MHALKEADSEAWSTLCELLRQAGGRLSDVMHLVACCLPASKCWRDLHGLPCSLRKACTADLQGGPSQLNAPAKPDHESSMPGRASMSATHCSSQQSWSTHVQAHQSTARQAKVSRPGKPAWARAPAAGKGPECRSLPPTGCEWTPRHAPHRCTSRPSSACMLDLYSCCLVVSQTCRTGLQWTWMPCLRPAWHSDAVAGTTA